MKTLKKFRAFLPIDMYCWLAGAAKVEHKTVSVKLEELIRKELDAREEE